MRKKSHCLSVLLKINPFWVEMSWSFWVFHPLWILFVNYISVIHVFFWLMVRFPVLSVDFVYQTVPPLSICPNSGQRHLRNALPRLKRRNKGYEMSWLNQSRGANEITHQSRFRRTMEWIYLYLGCGPTYTQHAHNTQEASHAHDWWVDLKFDLDCLSFQFGYP